MWLAILSVRANGKRIVETEEWKWSRLQGVDGSEIEGCGMSVRVRESRVSDTGVDCDKPGSKNVAGDTLWDPRTPPQPCTITSPQRIAIARQTGFHLNFIRGTIESLAMFAISISPHLRALPRSARYPAPALAVMVWVMMMLFTGRLLAGNPHRIESEAMEEARKALEIARRQYASSGFTNRHDCAWNLGKAAFDYAEFAAMATNRSRLAEEGIAASLVAIQLRPESAEGHYFLAMNRGQLARTKLLGALRLVIEIEKDLKAALARDSRIDHAGPDRSLGLLYFQAPGWPTSIGNKKKARQHLAKAFELDPNYPGNGLALMEACRHWGDTKTLNQLAREFESRLASMKERFAGKAWEWSWVEWDERWKVLIASAKRNPPGPGR